MLGILFIVSVFAIAAGIIISSLEYPKGFNPEKVNIDSKETVVTVGQYIHLIDAQFAQMRLESEGIEVYLGDDNLILMDPLCSLAIGGVRIQVRSSDAVRARELLETKPDTTATEEPAEKYQGDGDPCPQCGSRSTFPYRGISSVLSLVLYSLFSILIPVPGRKRMYCFDCKHKWKAPIRKKQDKDSPEE